MLGFLIRLLPFWVREPLLIVVGSVFGARLLYLGGVEQSWTLAGIGALFLVFTAVRVHTVVQALRARRNPAPAASEDGTRPDTPVPAPQGPAPAAPAAPAAREKEPNAWGQAFAAVAVFAALGAAAFLGPKLLPSEAHGTPHAVSCPGGQETELPSAYKKSPRTVTGAELCEALNTPDLARLLGTPTETATGASASNNTAPLTDGKVALPEAKVEFDTYTVNVAVTYNHLSIAQYVKLMDYGNEIDVKKAEVLGRPAVFSSDHTMRIEIDFGSGGSGGPVGQGPLARTLAVALDAEDRGGYYEITVWSTSGAFPDDDVLLGITEKVLPAVPERTV
ncbi:DUF6215 domain-containing protein [Streptomyces coelicoflavus]|uniref:DUF6215 domain-containing protein n=1 Tax=Streptomyces coelicoflavus TaxID=285562 RepID=UPI0024AE2AEF|nr:DUF6215 domain-containing protein [Streptomyces coelicoflavus]MDI6518091.1 DUF6215 domain-containing protein [Streptomyces coelicoflavus]